MSRLKKYAKKSKEEYHQYPWKVDYELFAFFSKYCESLNLSVNEGLSLLVSEEIESYKKELSEEEQEAILDEFRAKKGMVERLRACVHPHVSHGFHPGMFPGARGGGPDPGMAFGADPRRMRMMAEKMDQQQAGKAERDGGGQPSGSDADMPSERSAPRRGRPPASKPRQSDPKPPKPDQP